MRKIFFVFLMLPIIAFAQSEELVIGDRSVQYTEKEETESGVLYFIEEVLVASEHESVTLVYEDEIVVLEAHDIDRDGTLDAFLSLSAEGEVMNIEGDKSSAFERPEPIEFSELVANEEEGAGEAGTPSDEEDLVGSLDSITIPGSFNPLWFVVLIFAAIAAGWWHFKGRNKSG